MCRLHFLKVSSFKKNSKHYKIIIKVIHLGLDLLNSRNESTNGSGKFQVRSIDNAQIPCHVKRKIG